MTVDASTPVSIDDPINKRILEVSEDRVQGFEQRPFEFIAAESGIELDMVLRRIRAMLESGTIRRVRQTLLANKLAPGALVAWVAPGEQLNETFDWLHENDPFTGHVVIRTTDAKTAGSQYRLWTTLKVPQGYAMHNHCEHICRVTAAEQFLLMPAKKLFALGVGHVRRRKMEPGARSDVPGKVIDTDVVDLSDRDWQVIETLKREFEPHEIQRDPWRARAEEAGVPFEQYVQTAKSLDERGVVGRFSTFLEHVKKLYDGTTVTRYNALFHWAVPEGRELEAGREVGRHHIMTHGYWREGGPQFNNVNIMGVAHGTDKDLVLAHKQAIDQHLAEAGIAVHYTNVFWGGRSEIKPSEISPSAYVAWCEQQGLDPAAMQA